MEAHQESRRRATAAQSVAGALEGSALLVVHGISKHDRHAIQDTVTDGLVDALQRDLPASDSRWNSRVRPSAQPGWSKRVLGQEQWAGEWRFASIVTEVFESFWSPITRRTPRRRSGLSWAARTLPSIVSYISFASKTKFVSDALAAALLVSGIAAMLLAAIFVLFNLCIVAFVMVRTPPAFGIRVIAELFTVAVFCLVSWCCFAAVRTKRRAGAAVDDDVVDEQTAPGAPRPRLWKLLYGRRFQAVFKLVPSIIDSGWNVCFVLYAVGAIGSVKYKGDLTVVLLVALCAGTLLLGRAALSQIVDKLRDLETYTCTDENMPIYEDRRGMLDGVKADLRRLTGETATDGAPYQRIYVVGHSLGGQLAFDALVELADEALGAGPGAAAARIVLDRLGALVLVGAPIAVVDRYFQHHGVRRDEHRRCAVAKRLFAQARPDTDDLLPPVRLINVWSAADPISGPIAELIPSARDVRLRGLPWLVAHGMYFGHSELWPRVAAALEPLPP